MNMISDSAWPAGLSPKADCLPIVENSVDAMEMTAGQVEQEEEDSQSGLSNLDACQAVPSGGNGPAEASAFAAQQGAPESLKGVALEQEVTEAAAAAVIEEAEETAAAAVAAAAIVSHPFNHRLQRSSTATNNSNNSNNSNNTRTTKSSKSSTSSKHSYLSKGSKGSKSSSRPWTRQEHLQFVRGIHTHGRNWTKISHDFVTTRSPQELCHRYRQALRAKHHHDRQMVKPRPHSCNQPPRHWQLEQHPPQQQIQPPHQMDLQGTSHYDNLSASIDVTDSNHSSFTKGTLRRMTATTFTTAAATTTTTTGTFIGTPSEKRPSRKRTSFANTKTNTMTNTTTTTARPIVTSFQPPKVITIIRKTPSIHTTNNSWHDCEY